MLCGTTFYYSANLFIDVKSYPSLWFKNALKHSTFFFFFCKLLFFCFALRLILNISLIVKWFSYPFSALLLKKLIFSAMMSTVEEEGQVNPWSRTCIWSCWHRKVLSLGICILSLVLYAVFCKYVLFCRLLKSPCDFSQYYINWYF